MERSRPARGGGFGSCGPRAAPRRRFDMTLMGRMLRLLHTLAVLLMLGNVALGYGVAFGYVPVARHIPWGFFSALVIAFAHAMTMFYFAGIGVNMREASSGRRWCEPYLQTA